MSKLFNLSKTQKYIAGALGAAGLVMGKIYFNGGTNTISKDLTGKVVLITGANAGIGRETAKELAKMNATIIIASRDSERSLPIVEQIKARAKNQNIEFIQLDLGDLKSVKKFAEEFKAKYNKLDILINNAGVSGILDRKVTTDGFEMNFGINHLGHFYLTNLLLDRVKQSAPSRIINVSSRSHLKGIMDWDDLMGEKSYSERKAYEQSKLANVLFTRELQKRMDAEKSDVKVVAVHPGFVRTEIFRYAQEKPYIKMLLFFANPFMYYVGKNPLQGAQTSLYCALEDHKLLNGGDYYVDCKPGEIGAEGLKEEEGRKLWKISEELIASKVK